jgi:hypothetical protein
MEPGFTQEELDKITLSAEQLEHYSKPDELKRLLLERNFYKKVMEKQIESINTASSHLNSILDTPIYCTSKTYSNPFGFKKTRFIAKSARDLAYDYQLNNLANKLHSNYSIDTFQYNFKIEAYSK